MNNPSGARPISCAIAVVLTLLALPATGHATPITVDDTVPISLAVFDPTFGVLAGLTQPTSGYDAATNTYSVEADLGSAGDPAAIVDGAFANLITDFVGTFLLTANVDNTGIFLGGSYSWFGGSGSLGIAPASELISGTLSSVTFGNPLPSSAPGFQSIGSIDFINAALSALVGPADELLIYDFTLPGPLWNMDPWTVSYVSTTSFTGSPDLFGRPVAVAEPSTLALFGIGLAGIGLARRRATK